MNGEDDVIAGRLEKFADQCGEKTKQKDCKGCNSSWQNLNWKQRLYFWRAEPVDLKNFTQFPNQNQIKVKKVHNCKSFSSTGMKKNNLRIYELDYHMCRYGCGVNFLPLHVINLWLKHWFNFFFISKNFVIDRKKKHVTFLFGLLLHF